MKAEDVPSGWTEHDWLVICSKALQGNPNIRLGAWLPDIARPVFDAIAPLIAASEREACAKLVETHAYANGAEGPYLRPSEHAEHDIHHRTIAAAIRSRTGDK